MRLSLNRIYKSPNPLPTHKNVIPAGPGWYRFDGDKWRKWPGKYGNYDGAGRWLSDEQLAEFARDAING